MFVVAILVTQTVSVSLTPTVIAVCLFHTYEQHAAPCVEGERAVLHLLQTGLPERAEQLPLDLCLVHTGLFSGKDW